MEKYVIIASNNVQQNNTIFIVNNTLVVYYNEQFMTGPLRQQHIISLSNFCVNILPD